MLVGHGQDPFSSEVNYYLSSTFRLPTLFGLRGSPAISVYSERRGEYRVPAHDDHRRRGIAHSRGSSRTAVAPRLAGVRPNRRAAGAAVRRVQPLRQRVARAAHQEPPARGERASGSASHGQSREPRSGTTLRLDLRGAAKAIGSDDDQQFIKGLATDRIIGRCHPVTFAARLRLGPCSVATSRSATRWVRPAEERLRRRRGERPRFQQNEVGDLIYIAEDAPRETMGTRRTRCSMRILGASGVSSPSAATRYRRQPRAALPQRDLSGAHSVHRLPRRRQRVEPRMPATERRRCRPS